MSTCLAGLCTKLQQRSQPGIRAILAVLRDEITAQYLQQRKEAAGTPPTLGSNIELLFGMLDVLVEACLENLVGPDPLGGERPASLHAELHFRLRQMVCGRKWRYFRDLQLATAKRVASYAVR